MYVIVDLITGQSLFTMPFDIEHNIVSVDRYGVVFESGYMPELSVLQLNNQGLPTHKRDRCLRKEFKPLAYGYGYMVYLEDTLDEREKHTINVVSFH